ncbi:MAG TPA: SIS domain-containing protein [Candidatus Limnocylindrales bacterium]|nr:SIS domain-containing protein [Candidatus Limnocylindrales bacterium]
MASVLGEVLDGPEAPASAMRWFDHAVELLRRIERTQAAGIEQASQWCAEAIASGGLVHLFGTGHSRIPVEEMFPRYGSYPGFNPMVELSMTFHTQVVGSNGQRQAMQIERTPGLAEVILSNFGFGSRDVVMVFSASGLTAVPVEMARGARARGLRVIAVTSVTQSQSAEPEAAAGARLMDEADLVLDLCTPVADAMIEVEGLETPVGPGSTVAAVAIVNQIKVRVAELLVERGAMPPVITRGAVVGEERSRQLFEEAYREHARRIARAIDHEGGE